MYRREPDKEKTYSPIGRLSAKPGERIDGRPIQDVVRGYSQVASYYEDSIWHEFWTRNEVPLFRSAINRCKAKGMAIDIGTGTGRYAMLLREMGFASVIGFDLSAEMLRLAMRNVNRRGLDGIKLQQADALNLPLEDDVVQLACTSRCVEHIPSYRSFFSEMDRVTASNGWLVMSNIDPSYLGAPTIMPAAESTVSIEAYLRYPDEVIETAREVGGFIKVGHETITAANAIWPERLAREVGPVHRDNRPISHVFLFGKKPIG